VATEELPWGGPGQAWEVLLAGIDAPPPAPPAPEPPSPDDSAAAQADEPAPPPAPDGRLSLDELLAYQRSMADAQGVLRGPAGLDPRAAAPGLAGDGPPVGTLAPDFELSALEGGSRVRLSEWRGHRAVALIFGSYT
jgi:hypothetical protein